MKIMKKMLNAVFCSAAKYYVKEVCKKSAYTLMYVSHTFYPVSLSNSKKKKKKLNSYFI